MKKFLFYALLATLLVAFLNERRHEKENLSLRRENFFLRQELNRLVTKGEKIPLRADQAIEERRQVMAEKAEAVAAAKKQDDGE